MIYLDYAATSPVHPDVFDVMQVSLKTFANPASQHQAGKEANRAVLQARQGIATYLKVSPEELTFTSGGTESNNWVLMGLMRSLRYQGDARGLIVSAVEHSAVLEAARYLQRFEGVPLLELSPDSEGRILPPVLEAALEKQPTAVVSIMHANNETGAVNDLATLSHLAHTKGAYFHTDAVQSLGKIPLDLQTTFSQVDFLTATAHKVYGPKGVGLLFHRRGTPDLHPLFCGGGQEGGRRAGTLNTPAILGFAKAIDVLEREEAYRIEHLTHLTAYLMEGLTRLNPTGKLQFNTPQHPAHRVPGVVNISVLGVKGEKMVMHLDMQGIGVSSGSACHADRIEPSHVILAQCGDEARALSTLRISLGMPTTQEELDIFLESFENRLKRWGLLS
jgi:cysteine desulfurase